MKASFGRISLKGEFYLIAYFVRLCNKVKLFQCFVCRYLDPNDVKMRKDLSGELKELRNNVCSGMALVNILWITVNFMFQFRSPTVVTFQLPVCLKFCVCN